MDGQGGFRRYDPVAEQGREMRGIPRFRDVDLVAVLLVVESAVAYVIAVVLGSSTRGFRAWPTGGWMDGFVVTLVLVGAMGIGLVLGWGDWMQRTRRTIDFRELWSIPAGLGGVIALALFRTDVQPGRQDMLLLAATAALGIAIGLIPTREWWRDSGSQ